jgi:hypothetical protein
LRTTGDPRLPNRSLLVCGRSPLVNSLEHNAHAPPFELGYRTLELDGPPVDQPYLRRRHVRLSG